MRSYIATAHPAKDRFQYAQVRCIQQHSLFCHNILGSAPPGVPQRHPPADASRLGYWGIARAGHARSRWISMPARAPGQGTRLPEWRLVLDTPRRTGEGRTTRGGRQGWGSSRCSCRIGKAGHWWGCPCPEVVLNTQVVKVLAARPDRAAVLFEPVRRSRTTRKREGCYRPSLQARAV
jgi:hypothetical protein